MIIDLYFTKIAINSIEIARRELEVEKRIGFGVRWLINIDGIENEHRVPACLLAIGHPPQIYF